MVDTKLRAVVTADTSGYKRGMEQAKQATAGFGAAQEKARKVTQKFGQEVKDTSQPMSEAKEGAKGWRNTLASITPALGGFGAALDEYRDKMANANKSNTIGFKAFKLAAVAALAAVAFKVGQVAFKFASETAAMFDNTAYNRAMEERQVGLKKFKTALGGFMAPLVNAINSGIGKLFKGLATVFEKLYAGIIAVYQFFKTMLQPVIDGIGKAIDRIKAGFGALVESIKNGINSLAGMLGFGPVFKKTEKQATAAAAGVEAIGDAAEYAEGGLQGFDQINTMDGVTGDTKQAEEMTSLADKWGESAANFAEKLKGAFKPLDGIKDFLEGLTLDNVWESIKDGGRSAWKAVSGAATGAWDWIGNKARGVWSSIHSIGSTAWNGLVSIGTTAWSTISSVASNTWAAITGFATNTWNTIANVGTTIWGHITGFFSMAWENLTSGIRTAWDNAMGFVRGVGQTIAKLLHGDFTGAWTKITDTFKHLWESVTGWLRGVFERLFGWIQGVIDSIMGSVRWVLDKLEGAKNAVKDFGGKVVGGIKGALGIGAATGDVIQPSDGLQYRIVGDNKRETEVISPLSTMKQAVTEAITEMGGVARGGASNSTPIDITLQIDGKKLARWTYEDFQAVARQKGRRTIV